MEAKKGKKVMEKKAERKWKKAMEVVARKEGREMGELVAQQASKDMILLHYSNGDESAYKCIQSRLQDFGPLSTFVLATGLSYGFVSFQDLSAAQLAYSSLNSPEVLLPFVPKPHPISLVYTSIPYQLFSLASEECLDSIPVPGLLLTPDFLTPSEESFLLGHLDSGQWLTLTNRRVQHFGFDFMYGANTVDPDASTGSLPDWLSPLLSKIELVYGLRFDQMTANEYSPGDSIPPHVDSHSPFEEVLVAVSLGSGLGMLFSKGEEAYNVWLPERSMLAMTDESRYVWKHAIQQRRFDMYHGMAVFRSRRVSLTFRKVRRTPCECRFPQYCDRTEKREVELPKDVQKKFVQETYNHIAEHFSHTRYKPWPQVQEFLQQLAPGSIVLDVGCGNGKYLPCAPSSFVLGTDLSLGLLSIAASRGFPVFLADSLRLPIRSDTADAIISIAVVHHFSTKEMRQRAVTEILRVLRQGGMALIYVWAMEQSERTFERQDVFVPWHLQQCYDDSDASPGVPEAEKSSVVYQRYYHVFIKGELEALVLQANIDTCRFEVVRSYYDHSNWCVVCRKVAGGGGEGGRRNTVDLDYI